MGVCDIYEKIVNEFGEPEVDLFTTSENNECNFAWLLDLEASQIDAFTVF